MSECMTFDIYWMVVVVIKTTACFHLCKPQWGNQIQWWIQDFLLGGADLLGGANL